MAAHQKKARRLNAHLVFLDESGLLLAPLVRRTWAPRGQTPVFHQRGRHREKVSIVAALSLSPQRRRPGLYFALLPHRSIDSHALAAFLQMLGRHLRGPVIVIWDRLNTHRSRIVHRFLERHARFHVEFLPAYAPELNPVEMVWSYLKLNPLAQFAPAHAGELARFASRHARRLQRRPDLLRAFIRCARLSLRL